MPMFEYQCECGKRMDVLVRGTEPATCLDATEASDWCSRGGKLAKMISAPYVATGGERFVNSATGQPADASCGHCGQTPGSCATD